MKRRLFHKLPAVLCALCLLAVPLLLLPDGGRGPTAGELSDGSYLARLDSELSASLPRHEALRSLSLELRLFGGQTEQNGIFITDDELILNVEPPSEYLVDANLDAVTEFADNVGIPTYFLLLPTASAIRQQSLPQYVRGQVFNQKQFIEEVNSALSGRATVLDAYPVLFNARDDYIYYRTENNLTGLGGFYVYRVLGAKLLEGVETLSLGHYDVEYVTAGYYGDLYQLSPYKNITPDTISLYHYTRNPREYMVTHYENGERRTYHTLYPASQLELGGGPSVLLGGLSGITDIRSSTPHDASLLIFGDRTALAYVPFLANHYARITLVDMAQLDAGGYESINVQDYSQILFAYGVETFMHTDTPSRAVHFLDTMY